LRSSPPAPPIIGSPDPPFTLRILRGLTQLLRTTFARQISLSPLFDRVVTSMQQRLAIVAECVCRIRLSPSAL
jgi:hypothetical protein